MPKSNASYYLDIEAWKRRIGVDYIEALWCFEFPERDQSLPDVLLIGDSISQQYTLPTRRALAGIANLYRIPENGGHTHHGLEQLDDWLSTIKWDVIHFNFGLHDLKYWADGRMDRENGMQVSSPEVYGQNLHRIIARLKALAPQARLIYGLTTAVPEGSAGRDKGDAEKYNDVAKTVVGEYPEITVNDLYTVALPHMRERDVHFADEGAEALGRHVAEVIKEVLSSGAV